MSDWAQANIELRRRRDEMDAFKKREAEQAAAAAEAKRAQNGTPAVRLGGH